jgi:hypothetical protein
MDGRALLIGFGLGVVATLILDPRRAPGRSVFRDSPLSDADPTRPVPDTPLYDFATRAYGAVAMARGQWSLEHVEDDRLVERVRAVLGRHCSYPRIIQVEASDGEITLRGPVIAIEHQAVLSAAAAVRGVDSVIDELEPYESAKSFPALQR